VKSGTRRLGRIGGVFRGVRLSSLVQGGGPVLFLALMAVNLAGFLFHVIASRHLFPADYGALSALLGFVLVLGVPVSALQVAIAKEVAARRHPSLDKGILPIHVGTILGQAVIVGILGSLVMVAISPLIRSFLDIPGLMAPLLLGVYVIPVAIETVPRAVLLGEQRFRLLATGLLTGAVSRVVLTYLFVSAGYGLNGAMAATVLSEVLTAGMMLPALRSALRTADDSTPLQISWSEAAPGIVAFSGFWVLSTIDTFLARHFLARAQSGFYAAASIAASAAMFLPAAISQIAFPTFAATGGIGHRARSALAQALSAIIGLSVVSALLLLVFSKLLVRTVFGAAYAPSGAIIGILAVAAGGGGVITVLLLFLLARSSVVGAASCWLGVILAVVGIAAFHHSPDQIAVVMVVAMFTVLAVMLVLVVRRGDGEPRADEVTTGELWDLPEPEIDLTIVVPYYNPGDLLRSNVHRLIEVLSQWDGTFEVICVSDGSTDGSERLLEEIVHPALRRVVLPQNRGKGQALRVGLAMGRGRYLGFIDADGDLDPVLLLPFLEIVRLYQPDIVLGSKRHPMSEVEYPRIRRLYSWGYQQLIRVLFRLQIRDSQTGLKLVRREVLADVLPRMIEKRFAFDLEMFVVARYLGYSRLFEAPIRIEHQFTSTISVKSVLHMFTDTAAIFYRLRFLRYYDRPHNLSEVKTQSGTAPVHVPQP
jgi:O-antigen/teichoic acid export membrane protein